MQEVTGASEKLLVLSLGEGNTGLVNFIECYTFLFDCCFLLFQSEASPGLLSLACLPDILSHSKRDQAALTPPVFKIHHQIAPPAVLALCSSESPRKLYKHPPISCPELLFERQGISMGEWKSVKVTVLATSPQPNTQFILLCLEMWFSVISQPLSLLNGTCIPEEESRWAQGSRMFQGPNSWGLARNVDPSKQLLELDLKNRLIWSDSHRSSYP